MIKRQRYGPPPMVAVCCSVLPYQKKRLAELAQQTKRAKSELVREAFSLLFSAYAKLGYQDPLARKHD